MLSLCVSYPDSYNTKMIECYFMKGCITVLVIIATKGLSKTLVACKQWKDE